MKNHFVSEVLVTPCGPPPSFHPDMAHPLGKGQSAYGLDENFSICGALEREHINAAHSRFTFRCVFIHKRHTNTHLSPCCRVAHAACPLAWFSSGLTDNWMRVCVYVRKWAVVIVAWAGADRQCPGWAGGCGWPWWGSSLPERPELPCGELGGGWWRSRRFPPAAKAPQAPACRGRQRALK